MVVGGAPAAQAQRPVLDFVVAGHAREHPRVCRVGEPTCAEVFDGLRPAERERSSQFSVAFLSRALLPRRRVAAVLRPTRLHRDAFERSAALAARGREERRELADDDDDLHGVRLGPRR